MVDARPAERPEGAVGATSWHSPPVSALLEVDRLRGERRCDWLTPDASDAGARPLPLTPLLSSRGSGIALRAKADPGTRA